MKFGFSKKRHFALTGDSRSSILVELAKNHTGMTAPHLIAMAEEPLDGNVALRRLLLSTSGMQGEVSIALPLNFFEVATISLPIMAEEAIGKALPYHLAKVINRPLTDYVFDWQVTNRLKNGLQVTAYLFPASTFHTFRNEFSRRHLTVTHIEADVFAAFAYLAQAGKIDPAESSICALIWQDSISVAIYEKQLLTLVRSAPLQQPDFSKIESPYPSPETFADEDFIEQPHTQKSEIQEKSGFLVDTEEDAILAGYKEEDAILADFNILSQNPPRNNELETEQESPVEEKNKFASKILERRTDYLQQINLEIIRTRDYYASVHKGGTIKNAFIGGASEFWEDIQAITQASLNIDVNPVVENTTNSECSPILSALALGTGTRW